jgi:hypothetical protein
MDWIFLVQDRDQWSGHGNEFSVTVICWEILE